MKNRKIILIYDENVGMSDMRAKTQALFDIIANKTEIRFGNQTYMNEWRIEAMNGEIEVIVKFGDIEIPVLENGAIEEWPDGFFDTIDEQFAALFGF